MRYDEVQIKRARLAKGWTQARLAEAAGVNPATVSQVEAGLIQGPGTIRKLADALDLDLNSIIVVEEAQ